MKKKSDACAACGLPFLPNETCTLHGNGYASHETTQPDSMKRCRNELLRQLGRLPSDES
jgi:hypothetical protein